MAKSYVSSVIDAPLVEVWKHLRSFDGIGNYYSAVRGVDLADGKMGDQVGVLRTASLDGGSQIQERLVALSDLDHSFSYQLIDDDSLPLRAYTANVRLLPVTNGDRTFIEWHSEYEITGDPAEVHNFVENEIYLACMKGLQRLVA
jgi:Polyketide cyclase / dehydrase and lipid transport